MASIEFEGRRIALEDGDSVASALYRDGVRTFSRSFKFRRPRGLYCGTGDCPNCLVCVDDEPGARACVTPAAQGQKIRRGSGWPSADRDVLGFFWYLRPFLPVGFYYKILKRPRWLWPYAERVIRRIAGLAPVPGGRRAAAEVGAAPIAPGCSEGTPLASGDGGPPERRIVADHGGQGREAIRHYPDLCVIGGGPGGLAAALSAAERGESVVVAEEHGIGELLPPGPALTTVMAQREALLRHRNVAVLERALAVGIYDGLLVPVIGPQFLHLVYAKRVVVATGAVERHAVFPGNDRIGVWLGRGAARMAGRHGLEPGENVVFAGSDGESLETLEVLRAAGIRVVAALVPEALATSIQGDIRTISDGSIVRVLGRTRVKGAEVESPAGRETVACDAVVLSPGLTARDGLLRQSRHSGVVGAGEVLAPGCGLSAAIDSGRLAAAGEWMEPVESPMPACPKSGMVCLCEDVQASEMDSAWREGFQSTELLKRYTTATMGPCQGAMCHPHLRAIVAERSDSPIWSGPTTARPPARPVRLEDLAAGSRHSLELRTSLHERHLTLGARMEWAGAWKRPGDFGDSRAEYDAVRRAVGIMDIGTLGKFRVGGPDATEFLERLYPSSIGRVRPGRLRYSPMLNEAGYILDESVICRLDDQDYYLTLTSGGAERGEAWLRDWAEAWALRVYVVNQTATYGAINVAGPLARELLTRLSDDDLDAESFPYAHHRHISVAGVQCLALRVGFVGELSYELHHPALEGVVLWDALLGAGADLGVKPHGLDTVLLLRLEKGHIVVGQDTDFDSTPAKVGLSWAVRSDKPAFVGKVALERLSGLPQERRLAMIRFTGGRAPVEGAQLFDCGALVGYLTSSGWSPTLDCGVALGWLQSRGGAFPTTIVARDPVAGELPGEVVSEPFYDPEGARIRA